MSVLSSNRRMDHDEKPPQDIQSIDLTGLNLDPSTQALIQRLLNHIEFGHRFI